MYKEKTMEARILELYQWVRLGMLTMVEVSEILYREFGVKLEVVR
jgi:hypothetical protein